METGAMDSQQIGASETPAYVILGATGGIGSALSKRLAKRGADVLMCGRDTTKLAALQAAAGGETALVDARSLDSVESAVQSAVDPCGRLDGIANCVGSLLLKPAHLTTEEEWRATLAANLDSAFATVRAASKVMMRTGGSIVLVASAAARTGFPNHEAIAAAKAGVMGLALSAASTYAGYGIRVNAVAPGLVETPMTEALTRNEAAAKASRAMHALGRLGSPNDVAGALDWLLSTESAWVTGQVLGVDGGLATVRTRVKV
jgi:NAD(P)-dependent dehydrogenase (short-subunit alcohol dehydrogenase family)